jgi:hypothetical protein
MSEGRESTPRELSSRELLLLDIRIWECYHHRRRAFLEGFDRVVKAIAILGGSVAISKLFGDSKIAVPISGAVVVFFSTINLVCATSQAATRHYDLEKRFIDLEKKIIGVPEEKFTCVDNERFTNEALDIAAGEPPALQNLYALCYNTVFRAEGFGKNYYLKLKWYHHLPFITHIVDINPSGIISPIVGAANFPTKIS